MHPVIIIPARLASTRLPEKPLADIAGEPMIVHVWRRAMQAAIAAVVVACDDERIAAAIRRAGGQAVLTRTDHASGSDRIYEALCSFDKDKKYDVVINVQGDVPTLEPKLLHDLLRPLERPEVDIATLACPVADEAERRDPAVVKPVLSFLPGQKEMAHALYFSRACLPYGDGPVYHHIGVYAYRRAALERFVALPPSPLELREKLEQLRALEAGMTMGVAIADTSPLGVDTPEHLAKARALLENGA